MLSKSLTIDEKKDFTVTSTLTQKIKSEKKRIHVRFFELI